MTKLISKSDGEIEIKSSYSSSIFFLIIALVLLSLSASSGIPFYAMILASLFVAAILALVILSHVHSTRLTPSAIYFRRWGQTSEFAWSEVESWGIDHFPSGERNGIWIKMRNEDENRFIEPLPQEDMYTPIENSLRRYTNTDSVEA